MFDATAMVQAYLRVNGFLTVNEYPIIHRRQGGEFKEVTDVDLLAVRMPHAGRVLPRPRVRDGQSEQLHNDPLLDLEWGQQELIIAEVKEGVAKFNQAMFQHQVLREALRRFGACRRSELDPVVDALTRDGVATLADGTRVRLMGFGSRNSDRRSKIPFTFVSLSDVVGFLHEYIDAHWEIQSGAPFRDPVLRFLALLQKGVDGANDR